MKITDVKVFPVDEDKLKAYATITFDNCFIVRDLKVISGNKGYFIAMPSKKRKDGTFRDVAHPLNSETRKMIEDAVLEVYEKESASGAVSSGYPDEDPSEAGDSLAVSDIESGPPSYEDAVVDQEGEPASEEPDTGAPPAEEPESSEDTGKGAEENPVIEQTDDPEKAFVY